MISDIIPMVDSLYWVLIIIYLIVMAAHAWQGEISHAIYWLGVTILTLGVMGMGR